MMWWRFLIIALAVALSTVLVWPGQERTPHIVDTSQRPVTITTLPCDDNLQATSSGFVIDDQTIITVAHALFESRTTAVRDSTGRWHTNVQIVHMDLERDLAILRVRGLTANPVATRVARAGDPVHMLEGAASGTNGGEVLRRVRISTEVIGDLSTDSERRGYELSVAIAGGDSGAGVIDDDGNLVGVIFARSKRREAAWATSVFEINSILDERGVPDWDCERPTNIDLILEPLVPKLP